MFVYIIAGGARRQLPYCVVYLTKWGFWNQSNQLFFCSLSIRMVYACHKIVQKSLYCQFTSVGRHLHKSHWLFHRNSQKSLKNDQSATTKSTKNAFLRQVHPLNRSDSPVCWVNTYRSICFFIWQQRFTTLYIE